MHVPPQWKQTSVTIPMTAPNTSHMYTPVFRVTAFEDTYTVQAAKTSRLLGWSFVSVLFAAYSIPLAI